jgi:hypothetical protein
VCSLSFLNTLPEFVNYFPQLIPLAGPENFSFDAARPWNTKSASFLSTTSLNRPT